MEWRDCKLPIVDRQERELKEDQNVEWKKSWQDDYLKWICGFANAQGGRLVLGKDDAGKLTA